MTEAIRVAALLALVVSGSVSAQQQTVVVGSDAVISRLPPTFASHGTEMWQYMDQAANLSDSRLRNLASYVAPAVVRVGGITADWVRYVLPEDAGPVAHTVPRLSEEARRAMAGGRLHLDGFWPSAPENLTVATFYDLLDFCNATGLSLIFDLNELYGRNCHWQNTTDCVGPWDTSNVQAFLQYLQKAGVNTAHPPLIGFELGNELTRGNHINTSTNAADMWVMAGILKQVYANDPAGVPPFYAPSTDVCDDTAWYLMNATRGALHGFTYHSYPGTDGSQLQTQLLNVSWLRDDIFLNDRHANSSQCVLAWNKLIRGNGVELLLTETNSAYNAPKGITNGVWNILWYVASLGQYAATGITTHARWSLLGGAWPNPFALINVNGSRYDVAADFFVAVLHKRLIGSGVLAVSGASTSDPALAYAHCGQANNGSVVLMYVNPASVAVTADIEGLAATVPRLEYVLTAPNGDFNSSTPCLNDCQPGPLRANADGTLPPMPGAYVATGEGSSVVLAPRSAGFIVLLNAAASACKQ